MELAEIRDFVAAQGPFSRLPDAGLWQVTRSIAIEYHRRGTEIVALGTENLWLSLVRSGAVELQLGGTDLDARLGEGGVFGYPSLLTGQPTRNRVVALEDCLLYRIPKSVFLDLHQANPEFAAFFITEENQRLRQAVEQLKSSLPDGQTAAIHASVGDLLTTQPVVAAQQSDTIAAAARIMTQQDVSTLLIHDGDRLVGILTDKDLRRRVLGAGRNLTDAIATVMTPNPRTISADMPIMAALLLMQEMHIHHLPVLDQDGVVGVIGATDLLARIGSNTLQIANRIMSAPSPALTARATAHLPAAVAGLVQAGVDADNIGRFVSLVGERAHARILALAEADLGPPPVPYALVVFGSLARSEQALGSDQDNGFVLDESYDPAAHDAYFAALARRLCDGLNAAGYAWCPGNIMATNPEQRRTLDGWRAGFRRWITSPDPVAILNSTIFFDMRPVAGQVALVETLRADVLAMARANRIFQSFIARSAAATRIPLGFFRNLVLEHDAVEGEVLNLKTQGIAPIVDIGRAHALAVGITDANTQARLTLAADAGSLGREGADDLRDCLAFIRDVRFRHQGDQVKAGMPATNKIAPKHLSRFDREHLRDAFKVIRAQLDSLRNSMAGGVS